MDKLGEVIFTDGRSEEILALVGCRSRTLVQVVTPSGLYVYSKYKRYDYRDSQCVRYICTEGYAFSTVRPEYDSDGYFMNRYDVVDVTDEIVEFRLYDREIKV